MLISSGFKASRFIRNLDTTTIDKYKTYWKSITPVNDFDNWKRWIFSFLSVHTSWKQNVKGYKAVTGLATDFSRSALTDAIASSGVGLTKMRTEGIWRFNQEFWTCPQHWKRGVDETFEQCRDRLCKRTFGIGATKVSFVLEMLEPEECKVVCLDTHVLQLYNAPRSVPTLKRYKEIEEHWLTRCSAKSVPSPIARHIFWDRKQGYNLNDYWAHVFEDVDSSVVGV